MRHSFCLFLLLAGCGSSGPESQERAERGVTVELAPVEPAPPAEPIPPAEPVPPVPASLPSAREIAPNIIAEATPPAAPEPPPSRREPGAEKSEASARASSREKEESAPKEAEAGTTDSRFRPARMRLAGHVIARTIGRIGYPCGQVVSTEQVSTAGNARVYRVSCSSGHSYQATDRGRSMRFRKWSGVPSD